MFQGGLLVNTHAAPKSSRTVPFLEYARSARQDVAGNQVVDVLQVKKDTGKS